MKKLDFTLLTGSLVIAFILCGCSSVPQVDGPDYIAFESVNGVPVVPVVINNRVIKLCIDTGCDGDEITVKPKTILELGLKRVGSSLKSMDIEGSVHDEELYSTDKITIGTTTVDKVVVTEEKRDFVPYDGVIGNKLLERYKLFLDYGLCQARLLNKKDMNRLLRSGTWEAVPYTRNKAGIVLAVENEGTHYHFILDTGASVLDNGKVYGVIRKDMDDENRTGVKSGQNNQNTVEMSSAVLGDVSIGYLGFFEVPLPAAFPGDGLIGYNLLRDRRIIIDYETAHIYLARQKS